MKKELKELIDISHFYGVNKDYVIAGGGNTSFKDEQHLWVKGSGTSLSDITIDGFAQLERNKLKLISTKKYSNNNSERELQVKEDLNQSIVFPEKNVRPSVETSLHDIIKYRFVIHTHPTLVNGILCSKNGKAAVVELFGDEAMFVEYTDPGYILFKKVESDLEVYRKKHKKDPQIIFLENHGVFVSADSIDEVKSLYNLINKKISSKISKNPDLTKIEVNHIAIKVLPAIRMMLSSETIKVVKVRNNKLIENFLKDKKTYKEISSAFTPDIVVYCKSSFIYIEDSSTAEKIIESVKKESESFVSKHGYQPKVILVKGIGMIAIEENAKSVETVLDVYEDLMKISFFSNYFGGPKFLTAAQIDFIDKWEVENYRRAKAKGGSGQGKVENKIAIVTGAAKGFGEGIAEHLFNEGANVVIADLDEKCGLALVEKLNALKKKNTAYFVKVNVGDDKSVETMIAATVVEYGGLDIMVSNAGVLRAGALDEMKPEDFEFLTKINYTGYFYCVRHASAVMRIQHTFKPDYMMDIIQINSKSGLKGSNKNFAYAGSKFGSVGLTQSFAMELVSFNIKVNSICPGNFFEGPLWSDPKNGLFVQYLNTGKVPGAKTIADVKRFYESQVPLNRGCLPEDVMKAMFYIIDQYYETGQAIPVTGGQIMLK